MIAGNENIVINNDLKRLIVIFKAGKDLKVLAQPQDGAKAIYTSSSWLPAGVLTGKTYVETGKYTWFEVYTNHHTYGWVRRDNVAVVRQYQFPANSPLVVGKKVMLYRVSGENFYNLKAIQDGGKIAVFTGKSFVGINLEIYFEVKTLQGETGFLNINSIDWIETRKIQPKASAQSTAIETGDRSTDIREEKPKPTQATKPQTTQPVKPQTTQPVQQAKPVQSVKQEQNSRLTDAEQKKGNSAFGTALVVAVAGWIVKQFLG